MQQRKSKITLHVKAICKFSYDQGLEGDSVDVLADILTQPNQLDQASTNEIIRNLFPNTKVSDTTILNVIGCLGQGMSKPALSVQAALLKWLVMAYNVLESPNLLSKLYPVMFNLLDMISLRYAM
ncbi:MAG: hypothetical protein M1829_005896 [Trizodia sp. TS-e1964]|nr:MAG: hypothetical protein M1829_005896 [Trizodia sp. TS-e1964]